MISFSRTVCLCLVACALPTVGAAQDNKPAQKSTPPPPKTLNAAHILIAYKGAMRSEATRTKAEALALATKVAKEAQSPGADFAALAKKHSDGPSSVKGGDLGNFPPGQMVPAFSQATMKLKVGAVSGPVESDFGYHIILRKKPLEDLNAAHILIAHAGATRSKATRTEEEALKLATEVAKLAAAEGADFADLAKKHSDGPSKTKGGDLGVFPPGRMIPEFSAATQKLKIGQVSGPVKTAFGYHIILRKPLPMKASAKHILVQWKGATRADAKITRSKEEALARLTECIGKLKGGAEFEDLAVEYSDGPSNSRGGDLGEFAQGAMVPEFDKALFKLKVGAVSDVVETAFGYHIIYRYK